MQRRARLGLSLVLLALSTGLAAAGCDDKKPTSPADAGAADAGASTLVLDKDLSAAMAAMSASAPPGAASAAAPGDGPPQNGVFAPGAANAVIARGAAAKIEVLDKGREPRLAIAPLLAQGDKQKLTFSAHVRTGMQAMPNLDFGLELRVEKEKDKAKDAEEAAPAEGRVVIAKVTSVGLAGETAKLPKELETQLSQLKGSEVRFRLAANGAGSDYSITLPKGADPGLDTPVRALMESLSILTVAAPAEPVGAGGYWMVTDRSTSLGLEVVRYRVFRVEQIDGARAAIAVECRQYAAEPTATIAAVGPGSVGITVYESAGKGKVTIDGKQLALSAGGEISQRTGARLTQGGGAAPQQLGIQAEIGGQIVPAKGK
jgi:hypothetical protein